MRIDEVDRETGSHESYDPEGDLEALRQGLIAEAKGTLKRLTFLVGCTSEKLPIDSQIQELSRLCTILDGVEVDFKKNFF